jgi:hypothetical protein
MACPASAKETTATTEELLINKNETIVLDPQNFFSNVIIGGVLSIWNRDGDEFHEVI